ncbi:MAG: hypothetical protein RMK91_10740 [Pseudanabaenaceae cyanobacterium SKYGB_i_bin29]|nr:hypothetical protein [Pseudanabaenaceae cyanobacterium SKYG29]MDW8422330.1 hypothetical protein [Pseudanabaenaceae cyanobacterium SKYGB_i_bin29]
MSKLQFFLVSTIITSALLLFVGGRDSHTFVPISILVALSYLGNRFIPEPVWEQFARWVNRTTNRSLLKTKMKRLPPSRLRRLR